MISDEPNTVAVNKATNLVYSSNYLEGTVFVTDRVTKTLKAKIKVGHGPVGIVINSVTNKIYVTNREKDSVSVIDGTMNKVTATVSVISAAEAEKFDVALK